MKSISIIATSRRPGHCRSCGAAIEWATITTTNASMPFNRPIVLMPALHFEEALDSVRVDMAKTSSHFSTCPHAARWRRHALTTTKG